MNVVTELRKLETTKSFFARGGTGDVFPTINHLPFSYAAMRRS